LIYHASLKGKQENEEHPVENGGKNSAPFHTDHRRWLGWLAGWLAGWPGGQLAGWLAGAWVAGWRLGASWLGGQVVFSISQFNFQE